MTRPFSLTMQAHRLDLHRLWMVLLSVSILMALGWVGWATSDHIVVYENSISVQVTPWVSRYTTLEQGNVDRGRSFRRRWLEARFSKAARGSLWPGQEAVVFFEHGDTAEPAITAVITDVGDDRNHEQVRVMLRADVPEDAPDSFAHALADRVRVAVGTVAPIDLLLPVLAPSSGPPVPDGPRIRE
jgi:hypothetical protein